MIRNPEQLAALEGWHVLRRPRSRTGRPDTWWAHEPTGNLWARMDPLMADALVRQGRLRRAGPALQRPGINERWLYQPLSLP